MLLAAQSSSSSSQLSLLPDWTFVAELILFLIVLGVVAKWILPPIQAALAERQRQVRGALKTADEHRAEAERLAEERESVIGGARDEARRLIEESRRRVEALRGHARESADDERRRRLTLALTAFEAEQPLVRDAALGNVEQLVAAAVAHVLGAPVDIARHREVVQSLVRSALSGSGAEPAEG